MTDFPFVDATLRWTASRFAIAFAVAALTATDFDGSFFAISASRAAAAFPVGAVISICRPPGSVFTLKPTDSMSFLASAVSADTLIVEPFGMCPARPCTYSNCFWVSDSPGVDMVMASDDGMNPICAASSLAWSALSPNFWPAVTAVLHAVCMRASACCRAGTTAVPLARAKS